MGETAIIKGLWSYLTAGPACSGFLAVRKGKRGVEGWWLWGALCGQKCTPLAVHCSEPPPPPPLLSRWKLRHLMLRRLLLRWSVAYVCVCTYDVRIPHFKSTHYSTISQITRGPEKGKQIIQAFLKHFRKNSNPKKTKLSKKLKDFSGQNSTNQ